MHPHQRGHLYSAEEGIFLFCIDSDSVDSISMIFTIPISTGVSTTGPQLKKEAA
jgi:hypothetical protein